MLNRIHIVLTAVVGSLLQASPSYGQDTTSPRIIGVDPAPTVGVVDQIGLASIAVQFDEAVQVPAGSVTAWGIAAGPINPLKTAFDFGTNTLTIGLPEPVQADRVTIVLDFAITDMAGNALDGEIEDPSAPPLPSGDGEHGGQAVFRIDALQGDANRDGAVNEDDAALIVNALGSCSGDGGFDELADLNRDGCVNVLDVNIYQAGFGLELPSTDGQGPSITARDPDQGATIRALTFEMVVVELDEAVNPATVMSSSMFTVRPDGSVQPASDVSLGAGDTEVSFTFSPPLDQLGLHRLQLSNGVADASGELLHIETDRSWSAFLDFSPATMVASSPANGEIDVALTRETIVEFDFPLDQKFVGPDAFFATFGGETLPVLLHVSADATRVTLFYQDPLPPSALVRVHVVGDGLLDDLGNLVDADGDGGPGGTAEIDFATVTLTTLPGTRVCGRVFASELNDGGMNVPLQDVLVTVDGAADTLFATTDDQGNFCLDPAPVGTFFVHVDGKVASNPDTPDGAYYPNVGKPWTSIAGQEVNVGNVFLPLVIDGTLQDVSDVDDVTIGFPQQVIDENPELAGVEITVPAGSLFANDGTTGGQVGIAPVDPNRLPGQLPDVLDFPLVITVQAGPPNEGAMVPTNFDEPAPVVFPNLPHPVTGEVLAPGDKSALFSFDHDAGRWRVVGSMTVSADGAFVVSDPDVGILAPGWHGTQPGVAIDGDGGTCGDGDGGPSSGGDGPGPSCCDAGLVGGSAATSDCIAKMLVCVGAILACTAACTGSGGLACVGCLFIVSGSCTVAGIACDGCMASTAGTDLPPEVVQLTLFVQESQPVIEDLLELGITVDATGSISAEQEAVLEDILAQLEATAGGELVEQLGPLVEAGLSYLDELDVAPPVSGPQASAVNALIGTGDIRLRSHTAPNGSYSAILPASDAPAMALFYDPVTRQLATEGVSSLEAGTQATPSDYRFDVPESEFPDQDGDGLAGLAEVIIGTNALNPDTDGDGITDGAEIEQGTDPLDGLIVETGIIASADTPGLAPDVDAIDNLAIVADGESGISVFNVFNGMDPTIVAQVDTPGQALGVAAGGTLVAVADGTAGLAIIDIADPPAATIIHQLSSAVLVGAANAVEVTGDVVWVGTSLGEIVSVHMPTGAVLRRLTIGAEVHDIVTADGLLYALTADTLHVLAFDGNIVPLGSAPAPGGVNGVNGRKRLFVADGLAYAVHRFGYDLVDVSDEANPTLVPFGNTNQQGWKQIVANGSGLGVATVGVNQLFGEQHDVNLYDLSDPTNQAISIEERFITTIPTPGVARGVSIFNGLAYIADHANGLQVINYLPYDANGIPPTVSFTTTAEAGQIVGGSLLRVDVDVSDDIQVRNVELLLDGAVVQTDGNHPFQFFLRVPPADEGASSGANLLNLSVRASDTGGNDALADEVVIEIIPDTVPPTVIAAAPEQGIEIYRSELAQGAFTAGFSEAVDPATVGGGVTVTSAGPDGVLDTRDDELVAFDHALVDYDELLVVTFSIDIPAGPLRVTLRGDTITDLSGNVLDGDDDGEAGGDFVREFVVLANPGNLWILQADGSWHDGVNWSLGTPPAALDDVYLDVPGLRTITHSSGTTSAFRMQSQEALILAGGTLTLLELSSIDAPFTLSGGTLMGSATLFANGPVEWSAGTLWGSGTLLAAQGATISGATGARVITGHRTLALAGTSLLTADASAVFMNGNDQANELRILPGAVLDWQSDSTIRPSAFNGQHQGTVINEGTLQRTGAGTASIAASIMFDNLGTTEVLDGILESAFGGSNTGAMVIHGGGELAFIGGTFVSSGTIDVTSGGTLRTNAGGLILDGALTAATGSQLDLLGGTLAVNAATTIEGAVAQSGGSLSGNAALTLNGPYEWSAGTTSGPGTLHAALGATISGASTDSRLIAGGRTVELAGTSTLTAEGAGIKLSGNNLGNTLRILPGATFDWQSDSTIRPPVINDQHQGTVINEGTLLRTGTGTATFISGITFENTGLLDVGAGMLELKYAASNAGTIELRAGGLLHKFSFQPFTFMPGSEVIVHLAGTTPGSDHGTLDIDASAALAGTLAIIIDEGYTPAPGDTFDVVLYNALGSAFNAIEGTDLGDGLVLEPTYLADRLRLEVVMAAAGQ